MKQLKSYMERRNASFKRQLNNDKPSLTEMYCERDGDWILTGINSCYNYVPAWMPLCDECIDKKAQIMVMGILMTDDADRQEKIVEARKADPNYMVDWRMTGNPLHKAYTN